MTTDDRAAYAAAVEPWARRAEREHRLVSHVRWHDGHAEVTTEARKQHESVPAEQLL